MIEDDPARIVRFAFGLALLAALPAAAAEFRSIGERAAILYDAPSLKADRIFVASRGHPFEVLVKLDQWTKVRDAGGERADRHELPRSMHLLLLAHEPALPLGEAGVHSFEVGD